jgi:hypothetical protein
MCRPHSTVLSERRKNPVNDIEISPFDGRDGTVSGSATFRPAERVIGLGASVISPSARPEEFLADQAGMGTHVLTGRPGRCPGLSPRRGRRSEIPGRHVTHGAPRRLV